MPIDPNVFQRFSTFGDYQKAEQEFQLKKQMQQAQMMTAQAQLIKAGEIDADKLGEQAFMKSAQGIPLSAQEEAALRYIDAKSPTAAFNPVTGVMEQKPSLLDRAGLGGNMRQSAPAAASAPMAMPSPTAPRAAPIQTPDADRATLEIFDSEGAPAVEPTSEWDIAFQKELAAAAGNPKLQQTIRENYAKAKISMSEAEAKAAGFADRMLQSDPIIMDKQAAGMDLSQTSRAAIPILGNYVVSNDYQSFDQAQRDFINAQLRRESGAVISDAEFANARKQYFPVPGDSEQVLTQKKANREAAVNAMQRSAGPSYKPLKVKAPIKNGESETQPVELKPIQKPAISKTDAINELRRRGKL